MKKLHFAAYYAKEGNSRWGLATVPANYNLSELGRNFHAVAIRYLGAEKQTREFINEQNQLLTTAGAYMTDDEYLRMVRGVS